MCNELLCDEALLTQHEHGKWEVSLIAQMELNMEEVAASSRKNKTAENPSTRKYTLIEQNK